MVLGDGQEVTAARVILCTGTFLRGLMHVGETRTRGGREGAASSEGLSGELRRLGLRTRVLALSAHDDDRYVRGMLDAGALGYLLKDAAPDVLYNAIRAAARGESVLQPAVAARVVSQFARMAPAPAAEEVLVEPLSEREIEVLALIAAERDAKGIVAQPVSDDEIRDALRLLLERCKLAAEPAGAAALAAELLWSRGVARAVGPTHEALLTVAAPFLAGLGLGFTLGAIDRRPRRSAWCSNPMRRR